MSVVSFSERWALREKAYWDREARRLGFKDDADMEAAASEAFDAAWDELERNCTHPDKIPELNVCEQCAESFRI